MLLQFLGVVETEKSSGSLLTLMKLYSCSIISHVVHNWSRGIWNGRLKQGQSQWGFNMQSSRAVVLVPQLHNHEKYSSNLQVVILITFRLLCSRFRAFQKFAAMLSTDQQQEVFIFVHWIHLQIGSFRRSGFKMIILSQIEKQKHPIIWLHIYLQFSFLILSLKMLFEPKGLRPVAFYCKIKLRYI